MDYCNHQDCPNKAIYLEEFCWEHMSDKEKNNFPSKLLEYIKKNKAVTGQNFKKVVLNEIYFPNFTVFSDCDFSEAEFNKVSLQNADLRGAKFENAKLYDCHFEFTDFRGITTSLKRCDARGSHFDSASLQNVDFTDADLRDCIFIDSDLIGAKMLNAKLYAARLINTRIRKENFCNFDPIRPKKIKINDTFDDKLNRPTPLAAKYIYLSLKNNFRSIGEYDDERWAYVKERVMERKRLFYLAFHGDRYSDSLALERWDKRDKDKVFESRLIAGIRWLFSWVQWLFGYGEKPLRIFVLSFFVVFIFSFLFMFGGFRHSFNGDEVTINRSFAFDASELTNTISDWYLSLYMSVITFSTLGYGDVHPLGITRVVASVEALLGLVLMAMFVAVFARIIIRD